MAMQVWPPKAGKVARGIGAVVPEQKDGVANYVLVRVSNAYIAVRARKILVGIFFESLGCIICEYDKWRWCLFGRVLACTCSDLGGLAALLDSEHSPWSCREHASAGRRCDRSCGCKGRWSGG